MALFELITSLLNTFSPNTLIIIENKDNFEILETKVFRVIQNFTYEELGALKVQKIEHRIAKGKKYIFVTVDYN